MRLTSFRRPVLALALSALFLGAPTPSARVTEVRVGAHPTFTRVVFELDGRAGYQIQTRKISGRQELVVTLQAASTPRKLAGHGPLISGVEVEPGDGNAVAHVKLRGEASSVKEMILANPPRIVLDFMLPESLAKAASEATAAAVKTPTAPAPEKPPAPAQPVAKVPPTPEAPKPIATVEPAPEAPKPIETVEPAPTPPKPVAKVEPVPTTPAPEKTAAATPIPPAPLPALPQPAEAAPSETAPVATAEPHVPAPVAPKPLASTKPPAALPSIGVGSWLPPLRGFSDPILLLTLGGAGLVLLLIVVVMLVRRRSQRTALDALESHREGESSADLGPFGIGEMTAPVEAFEAEPHPTLPVAAPGLFDDDEPEKESVMDMGAQVSSGSSGLGTTRAGADSDVARLVREVERRVAQLESRLDEANEARERLERQVTAQSEELRVQRAAIARTQRALRGISRGGEEQATEPALREPSTPGRA